MVRFIGLLASALVALVSCGTWVTKADAVFTPEEQALFLSAIPDRGDRVDALVRNRPPRPAPKANSLSAADARADLDALFDAVERIHPSYWLAFGGQEGYRHWRSRAGAWLDHLTYQGSVSRSDLALVLSYATAGFEDGHTGLPLRWEAGGQVSAVGVVPPWPLVWKGDRWMVDGSELLRLNGQTPDRALEPVLLAVPGETLAWRANLASDELGYYLRLVDPFAGVRRFRAELADGRVLEGPPGERWRFEADQRLAGAGPAPGGPVFTDLGGGVGLYDYRSFDASEGGLKAMDEVFRQAAAAGVRDLVIDLRANGGGSTNAGDALLGHLTQTPFRQFRRVLARWSREAAEQSRRGGQQITPLEGCWTWFDGAPAPVAARSPTLPCRLHLLVGPGTFSSASDFAMAVLDYGLGDLWGYETGGVRTCAGDQLRVSLPKTDWALGVSWKVFFGPKPTPGESRHGAQPDHPATAEVLAPFRGEADPVRAWAVAGIRAPVSP